MSQDPSPSAERRAAFWQVAAVTCLALAGLMALGGGWPQAGVFGALAGLAAMPLLHPELRRARTAAARRPARPGRGAATLGAGVRRRLRPDATPEEQRSLAVEALAITVGSLVLVVVVALFVTPAPGLLLCLLLAAPAARGHVIALAAMTAMPDARWPRAVRDVATVFWFALFTAWFVLLMRLVAYGLTGDASLW